MKDLKELFEALNTPPKPEHIKKNDDGSLYLPITVVEDKLDELFGIWSWELEHEIFGKNYIAGRGKLSIAYVKEYSYEISKTGTAAVLMTGDLKLDYPRLEAMCILNAAKKFGRCFGRDLNRGLDDSPLPVTQLREKNQEDDEFAARDKIKAALIVAETREDCENIIGQSGMEWIFKNDMQVKEILKNKPSKKTA